MTIYHDSVGSNRPKLSQTHHFQNDSSWPKVKYSTMALIRFKRKSESHVPRHRILAKIFSYSGALIQAIFITINYLQFNTTTNVYIRNPSETELPAVSLCFFYKLEELNLYDSGEFQNLTNLNLGQIDDKLTRYEHFILSCRVLDANYDYRDCLAVYRTQPVQYLSLYSKCYTLFEWLKPPIKYEKRKIGSTWIIDVNLNVTMISTNKIGIFLTHTTEELDESLGNPSFLQFDTKNNNRATVTFERTIIRKQPPPYDSQCKDYSKILCQNRNTCIKKCITETSFAKSKAWVKRRYVRLNDRYIEGRFGLEDETNFTEKCYRYFEESQCVDYLYNSIMASQFLSPFRSNDTFQINVAYPLGMETEVVYVELQSFIEYMCYVTSVISLWTEASIIRVSEHGLELLARFAPVMAMKISRRVTIKNSRSHRESANCKTRGESLSSVDDQASKDIFKTNQSFWSNPSISDFSGKFHQSVQSHYPGIPISRVIYQSPFHIKH